jgi:hypothetical protein
VTPRLLLAIPKQGSGPPLLRDELDISFAIGFALERAATGRKPEPCNNDAMKAGYILCVQ